MQSEYSFDAGEYRCTATRSDRPWGNGLTVKIFDHSETLLNVVHFGCHPERPGYDALQAMSTEQLIALAIHQLRTENCLESLRQVREHGFQLYIAFEMPE
jgi:hypothetical protein